ncbi:hypothetical protein AAFC00_002569 [Neodothiora populina]|uniref:Cwf18 pre-mRNA splicing factor n=1 Tax=Neodothiora populina TaxID=2781224 RepID=A0ABR3P7U0_9PEZI
MSSGGLANAAEDRKARLAALKSLKRKQPEPDATTDQDADSSLPAPRSPRHDTNDDNDAAAAAAKSVTSTYLSGRNYDAETRAPKFGFEHNPASSTETLEAKALELSEATRLQAEKDALEESKPLDLFKLQPKKPNWDLKRDLDRKLDVLNVRTENAIARLVRERIAAQQAAKRKESAGTATTATANGNGDKEKDELGMDGASFVEATREREREDEEDARRDKVLDEELENGS